MISPSTRSTSIRPPRSIIDYHGGLADLKKRVLRVIGDPATRYREDPVRMLRAVRLAAKLGLTLDPATRAPIRQLAPLMERVPPARLFDEMLKLLLSGHASACLRQLRDEGLHHGVLPLLDVILEQPLGERFVTLALAQTDERVLTDRPVSPAFLFAALLWHEVLAAWRAREKRGERPTPALEEAMDEVLDTQCETLAITRRLTATMREIWAMQPRFEQRSGVRAQRLLDAPRFRMAYDFLALRAASGEVPCRAGSLVARVPERGRRYTQRNARARHRSDEETPSAPTQEGPLGPTTPRRGDARRVHRYRFEPRRTACACARGDSTSSTRFPRRRVSGRSSLYRSAAIGGPPQPDYVNAVARLETGLAPEDLLAALLAIETRHGRSRTRAERTAHARPRPAAL